MQKFEYRAPRYEVDLPVQLTVEGSSVMGRCKEISKEGVKAEFPQPLPQNATGILLVRYREVALEVRVRVAHAGPNYDGLKFLFGSDADRKNAEHLVAMLTATARRLGPVLVK
jgi:hypothetical protein